MLGFIGSLVENNKMVEGIAYFHRMLDKIDIITLTLIFSFVGILIGFGVVIYSTYQSIPISIKKEIKEEMKNKRRKK